METQNLLSYHYKFISPENIIILSVSSNDFLHVTFEVAEHKARKRERGREKQTDRFSQTNRETDRQTYGVDVNKGDKIVE